MEDTPFISDEALRRIAEDCLCLRIQRASRTIGRLFDDAFRSAGLTNWQFSTLMALAVLRQPTVTELAEQLAMDRTTVTRNLQPLERRGLVEIRQDDKDARIRRISLTEAGRRALTEAATHWQRRNDEIAQRLKDLDVGAFRTALERAAQD